MKEKENKPACSRDKHVIQMRCELVLYANEHMLHMAHNKQYAFSGPKIYRKKEQTKNSKSTEHYVLKYCEVHIQST